MIDDGSPAQDPGIPGAPARRGRRRWAAAGFAAIVVAATVVAAAVLAWRWPSRQPVAHRPPAPLESDEPALVDPPGYVGQQSCAGCHAERVIEFEKTNHFHTFRRAGADTMPLAGFAREQATFASSDPALRFEMTRAGDEFYETAIRTAPAGEERTRSSIDRIIGAGTADDVYVSWHPDGRMYELPIAWLHTSRQWGAANFDPFGAGDHARELNPRCVECHNTWIHHVPGTPNRYQREQALFGVTCERCHGPGSDHVAFHREHPQADRGRHIVHPARLTRDLQLAVCTQCHSNAMKRRGPAFSYRPGQPLESSFRTLQTRHNEDDHVANQIQYLRRSRCFQEGDSLTCTTCHDPHRGRDAGSRTTGKSCLNCHQPGDCGEQERLPAAVRGNCSGCHMPAYVKMNVAFATRDDAQMPPLLRSEHRIAVYPRATDSVLLDWYRAQTDEPSRQEAARRAAALVQNWVADAEELQGQHRLLAAIGAYREALRVEESPVVREKLRESVSVQVQLDRDYARALHAIDEHRFREAVELLEAVLRRKPDLAKAHGRLGTAWAALGNMTRATDHWRAVVEYDPDDSYGEAMLGWAAFIDGRGTAALGHLERAAEIEPYNAKIEFHAALALLAIPRRDEAIERLRKVLEIDPEHAEACHQLAGALCDAGRPEDARAFAERSVRLTKNGNLDALLGLVRAYFDADRFDQAQSTSTRALTLAQERAPARLPEVYAWIDRIDRRAKGAE